MYEKSAESNIIRKKRTDGQCTAPGAFKKSLKSGYPSLILPTFGDNLNSLFKFRFLSNQTFEFEFQMAVRTRNA